MSGPRLTNLLGAIAVAVSDRLAASVTDLVGMGGEAPAAILTIGTRPDRSIDHLRRTLAMSHSGAVRLVDRLEDRGWVVRSRSEGRVVRLTLTADGEAVFDGILQTRRAVLDDTLHPLAPTERRALERALDRLLEHLPVKRQDAWRICRLCEHGVCREEACPVGRGVASEGHGTPES